MTTTYSSAYDAVIDWLGCYGIPLGRIIAEATLAKTPDERLIVRFRRDVKGWTRREVARAFATARRELLPPETNAR